MFCASGNLQLTQLSGGVSTDEHSDGVTTLLERGLCSNNMEFAVQGDWELIVDGTDLWGLAENEMMSAA